MINKIREFLFQNARKKRLIESILDLSRREPNNYQFGSAVREKINLYKSGTFENPGEKKRYSH